MHYNARADIIEILRRLWWIWKDAHVPPRPELKPIIETHEHPESVLLSGCSCSLELTDYLISLPFTNTLAVPLALIAPAVPVP